MNGAVMIETTFMGIATAFAITSGWFNPILLGNNSLKQGKVKITTTIPTAMET
jgi:hypothetical protein